jgi:hypothetical protein
VSHRSLLGASSTRPNAAGCARRRLQDLRDRQKRKGGRPHQIRRGSITWQRDLGIPPAVVTERVNASTDVIKLHYDAASPREQMERRRRPFIDNLEIEDDDDTETDD